MTPPPSGLANAAGSLRQEMAASSIATIALTGLVLYLIFKRKDWL